MKKLISLFCALFLLCPVCMAEEFIPDLSAVTPLQAALWRCNVTQDPLELAGSGVPEPLFDKVEILLAEVGMAGGWLCGGAVVRPVDPETTLLMPGSAIKDEDCPYWDGRTWLEVAAAEGKELYAVYIYPVALDASPMYALDSLALHGGARVTFGYGERDTAMPDTLDLTVQIYQVAADGKFTKVVDTLVSLPTEGTLAGESAEGVV